MHNPIRSVWVIWWWLVWAGSTVLCLSIEWLRHRSDGPEDWSPFWRAVGTWASDTPMYLPICLLFPLAWWLRAGLHVHRSDLLRDVVSRWTAWCHNSRTQSASDPDSRGDTGLTSLQSAAPAPVRRYDWVLALMVAGLSGCSSWYVSRTMADLPPAFHDEYSYTLQAQTLLQGRLANPVAPALPELFDQVHVWNRNTFASRYYPGTGLWLAPWLALGHIYWGQWLAGALTAFFLYWTGRELAGSGVGLLAGLLAALSPGLALFSNLLLAHHPTLCGLACFLFGFIRWMNHRQTGWLVLSAVGLVLAMLSRPATAAAVGLPFGIWLAVWFLRQSTPQQRWPVIFAFGIPLLAGWGLMVRYNAAVTGDWRQSPYQAYTDYYTPRHVFGFDNVSRGARRQGDRVLPYVTRDYDAWAENLDGKLAAKNAWNRLVASWRWSWGIIPLVWLCASGGPLLRGRHPAWKLLAAGIMCLHGVHVPYWFDGIMHWHYVFESSMLWLLLLAGSVGALSQIWWQGDRPWLVIWLGAFLGMGAVTNYVSGIPYWVAPLENGIAEVRFARRMHGSFQRLLRTQVTQLPALVLVVPNPKDRHIDLVTNDATLDGPILIGRYVAEELPPDVLRQIVDAYPERSLYIYDATTRQLSPLAP